MTEKEKRSGSKSATMKVAIVGLVAGLVGGGAAAGGVAYLNNSGMLAPSAVTTGKTTPVIVQVRIVTLQICKQLLKDLVLFTRSRVAQPTL